MLLIFVLRVFMAAIDATAIRAASSEYSIRSWPSSSRTKRLNRFFILCLLRLIDGAREHPAACMVGGAIPHVRMGPSALSARNGAEQLIDALPLAQSSRPFGLNSIGC